MQALTIDIFLRSLLRDGTVGMKINSKDHMILQIFFSQLFFGSINIISS